jgi:hypothetical protein
MNRSNTPVLSTVSKVRSPLWLGTEAEFKVAQVRAQIKIGEAAMAVAAR